MPDVPGYRAIAYEVDDGAATITLDRPERLNAFTDRMCEELLDAFDRVDADDDVRVAILTGRGRGFCAGADLSGGGSTFDYRPPSGEVPRDGGGRVSLRIFESTEPVIAAINAARRLPRPGQRRPSGSLRFPLPG